MTKWISVEEEYVLVNVARYTAREGWGVTHWKNFIHKLNTNFYQDNDDLFYRDAIEILCQNYDISRDNPKLEKLFTIAWELGHAEGHYSVWAYMEEMVGLIR